MNLIKGKWYKNLPETETFARCASIKINGFDYNEAIYNRNYTLNNGSWEYHNQMIEVSLEEIQQYLPNNHPDKITMNTEEDMSYLVTLLNKLKITNE